MSGLLVYIHYKYEKSFTPSPTEASALHYNVNFTAVALLWYYSHSPSLSSLHDTVKFFFLLISEGTAVVMTGSMSSLSVVLLNPGSSSMGVLTALRGSGLSNLSVRHFFATWMTAFSKEGDWSSCQHQSEDEIATLSVILWTADLETGNGITYL